MLEVKTFGALLREAGFRFGNRPFLIDDQWIGAVSYLELDRFAVGLGKQLDELGVPVGAPVAMLVHNCGLAASLFMAVMASRRVLVPLNPIATNYELKYMLDMSKCAAVIVDFTHTLTNDFGNMLVIQIADHRTFFARCCSEAADSCNGIYGAVVDEPFIGEIVFTSGSTGRPKGVLLSERSLIANASALAAVYELRSTDRFLTVCPLFHNSGQVFTTLACSLVGGSTVAVRSAVGMLHFWSYVDKYGANWSLGMVSFLALLMSRPEAPRDSSLMRGLLTGGSSIDGALIQRFETRFRVPVRTIYGLTETSSISTCEYLNPNPRSLGGSGRPLPICKVVIDSPAGPPATAEGDGSSLRGEILISGEHVFARYINDPESTRLRKRDGWVHTGDVGYFDKNGNLFVVDRLDSMLIVGGENVYPAEIEKLCSVLPGAAEIMLAGIDHAIWGKELILVYRAEDGVMPSMDSWRRVIRQHIAEIKMPQRYVAIQELGLQELPRKENGKLDRQAVVRLLRGWVLDMSRVSRLN